MKQKRVFVSHVVPKDMIEKLPVSPAGNYFSYNLISGNLFDRVISLVPVNIQQKIVTKNNDVCFIQNRFFPHHNIFKAVNILLENIQLIFSIKKHSNVWFYNLTIHTLFAFLILRYIRKSVKTYIIVLDFMPAVSRFSLQNFILKLIVDACGIISLSSNPSLKNGNKLVIPGIVTENVEIKKMTIVNNKFLLSGLLSKKRSPDLIFEVFSKFPEYELIVTGKVYEKIWIDQYSIYPNIKFLGFLTYEKYQEIMESCTVCINSRNPDYMENEFNFPSKLIEYLLNNKIVVSTMKYSEIENLNYFYVEHNFDSLCHFLQTFRTIDKEILLSKYANQSFVLLEKFGAGQWKNSFKIIEK